MSAFIPSMLSLSRAKWSIAFPWGKCLSYLVREDESLLSSSYLPQRRGEYFSAERERKGLVISSTLVGLKKKKSNITSTPFWEHALMKRHIRQWFHEIINCVFLFFINYPVLQSQLVRAAKPGWKWVWLIQKLASQLKPLSLFQRKISWGLLGSWIHHWRILPPAEDGIWKDITCAALTLVESSSFACCGRHQARKSLQPERALRQRNLDQSLMAQWKPPSHSLVDSFIQSQLSEHLWFADHLFKNHPCKDKASLTAEVSLSLWRARYGSTSSECNLGRAMAVWQTKRPWSQQKVGLTLKEVWWSTQILSHCILKG